MDLDRLRTAAKSLLVEEGLWDQGWRFVLSNKHKSVFGVCVYKPKHVIVTHYYAERAPEADVLDTLKHEVAHAITGHANGHNAIWRAVAVRLGAKPTACSPNVHYLPPKKKGKYRAKCPTCQQSYHRKSKPLQPLVCAKGGCKGRGSLNFVCTS